MTDDAMLIIDMQTALLNAHPARELDVACNIRPLRAAG